MEPFKTLYLTGFTSNVSINDIRNLLSKVSTVCDVYIPPTTCTGIIRNFAMIKVENKENLSKYVSSLNHSTWRGSKIRLEFAREFYMDKLNREREEEINQINDSDGENQDTDITNNLINEYKPPPFIAKKLVLVVSKNLQKYLTVGTEPSTGPTQMKYRSKNKIVRCHKVIFNDEGCIIPTAPHAWPTDDIEEEDDANKDQNKPVVKLAPEYRGGGLRKGFGTLTKVQVTDVTSGHVQTEPELRIPAAEDIEDETPCISTEDLAAEALTKERNRYSALLQQMTPKLTSSDQPTSHPTTISDFTTDKSNSTSNAHNKESSLEPGASFVNLGALKQIYHKEGGVWWGSDEKTTGAVGRGDEAEDEVFREAEKLGIDIRPSSLFGNTQEGTTNDVVDNNGGGSGMLFGFFNSSEGDVGTGADNADGILSSSAVNGGESDPFSMDWTKIAIQALKFSRVG